MSVNFFCMRFNCSGDCGNSAAGDFGDSPKGNVQTD